MNPINLIFAGANVCAVSVVWFDGGISYSESAVETPDRLCSDADSLLHVGCGSTCLGIHLHFHSHLHHLGSGFR